jgi:hypothetical protein
MLPKAFLSYKNMIHKHMVNKIVKHIYTMFFWGDTSLYHITFQGMLALTAIRLYCTQKIHPIYTQNKSATSEDTFLHGQDSRQNNKQKIVLVIPLVFSLSFSIMY